MLRKQDIIDFIKSNQLENQVLSVHMAIRSLGEIEGGLDNLINTFVECGCTIMGPTYTWSFVLDNTRTDITLNKKSIAFSDRQWNFQQLKTSSLEDVFNVDTQVVDKELGFFSTYLAKHPLRKRSNNPISSVCAIGPKAEEIVYGENHFYQPFRKLVELKGKVLLIGIDVDKMSLIHSIKEKAGSQMLIRWVKSSENETSWVAGGGCSTGFKKLIPYFQELIFETQLGQATTKILDASKVEEILLPILKKQAPNYPTCDDVSCKLCKEASFDFKPSNENDFYVLEPNDNLWEVANKHNKSFTHLMEKYVEHPSLMTGQIIDWEGIPNKLDFQQTNPTYHVVKQGETLELIAQQYKVQSKDLFSQFKNPTTIKVGCYVEIPQ